MYIDRVHGSRQELVALLRASGVPVRAWCSLRSIVLERLILKSVLLQMKGRVTRKVGRAFETKLV